MQGLVYERRNSNEATSLLTLFAHVLDTEHAGIAETMIDFGLREGTFNGFFSPGVDATADTGLGKGDDIIQSILPNMSVHHPSGRALAEAFIAFGTSPTDFRVAEVLAVPLPGGGFPVKMLVLRANVGVEEWVVSEAVFPVVFTTVRMPPVANDTLYALRLQKMCNRCVVVSGVQSHILGQLAQPRFYLIQYLGHWGHVVDVRRFHMDVYDDVVGAVHRAVLAVVEAIRLAIPALLAAVRVGRALHLCCGVSRSAAFAILVVVIPVERFFAQHLPVQVHLFVQFFQIGLGRAFHGHQLLLVLVGLRLDVRGIRVQNRATYQPLGYALTKYFVEDLLWYVVVAFWLIVVASGAFSVRSSPQNHLYAML